MANLLDLRKGKETKETKEAKKVSRKIGRNAVFSAILLVGVAFSIVTVMRAAAPDPGHNLAEIDMAGFAGSADIVTLGTIATGTWNGTAINDTYISSASTWNAKENALTFSLPFLRVGDTISISQANSITDGYLSSTDWNTFNNKQPAGTYATLVLGKIPTSQIPDSILGKVEYKGTWDAGANVPDLPASTPTKGDYYVVSADGATSLGGITDWKIGDWAIYDGAAWGKVENTDSVSSVNTRTGPILLDKSDVGLNNVENTALSTWAGTGSIVNLGTIISGIWNGTAIDDAYISSAATWNAKQDALTYEIKSGKVAVTEGTPVAVTFTTAFSSTPNCTCAVDLGGTGGSSRGECFFTAAGTPSTTGFSLDWNNSTGGPASTEDIQWMCTDAGNP